MACVSRTIVPHLISGSSDASGASCNGRTSCNVVCASMGASFNGSRISRRMASETNSRTRCSSSAGRVAACSMLSK